MTQAPVQLPELLDFIQRERGLDLSGYKRTTLERRVQRRLSALGVASYGSYLALLEDRPEELTELFNTVLINVTRFFRDPEVWETLMTDALAGLVAAKGEGAAVRAWSVGCSSGQEAYTCAMVLAELLGPDALKRLKVYGTDVDDDALAQARRSTYDPRDLDDVPVALRERYFEPVAGAFRVRQELRQCVIFGRHDLVRDPPISRLDLLTCRNTIMYLTAETQARVHPRFHFALAPSGVLVLGKAEMLLGRAELFTAVNLKQRIFRKASLDAAPERIAMRLPAKEESSPDSAAARLRDRVFDAGPVAQLVVDASGVVSQINRQARDTFGLTEHDRGRPFQDLEVSYRPVELRSALEEAYAEARVVILRGIERQRPGEVLCYEIHVTPLGDRETQGLLGAEISFIDVTQATRLQQQLLRTNTELQAAFEQLQSTMEELETTNEELQSTNEELETTNEELQSSNEELETMNEELQSTNQAQHALADQVRHRTDDLTSANLSLEAVLATLRSAIIVIDRELRVTRWSARAEDLWGLRAEEANGKSLMGLDIGLPVEKLGPGIRACFAGEPVDELVLDATNRRGRPMVCRVASLPLARPQEPAAEVRAVVLVIVEAGAAAPRPRG